MLTDIFGNYPQVRVLDFLIENRTYDYSLSDIARGSSVARPTLYVIIEALQELEIVVENRKAGNARMFSLNKESRVVETLSKFDLELSKRLVENELHRQDDVKETSSEPEGTKQET